MKKVGIATDSNSGILPEEAQRLNVKVLPMPFFIDGVCYYEEVSISREAFFEALNSGKEVSTSQPTPESVMELWREVLKDYDEVLYIPMSSGLSGSCATAMVLAKEPEFQDRVFVVDNGRVATPLHRCILDTLELIKEGYSVAQIRDRLEASKEKMVIYIAVETLEHLKRGGRITPATAAIGTLLNIKPILRFDIGVLESYKKCRGMKKARKELLETMRMEMTTTFREEYEKGELYLLAATSADKETTREWIAEIEAFFPGMEVLCDSLSLGLSCHIGEGGLGIACSCKP